MGLPKMFVITEKNSNIIKGILTEPFIDFAKKNLFCFDIIEVINSSCLIYTEITTNKNKHIIVLLEYSAQTNINIPLYPKFYLIEDSLTYSKSEYQEIERLLQIQTNIIRNLETPLHEETYMHIEPNMFIECWNGTSGYVIENKGAFITIDNELTPTINIADIKNIHRTPIDKELTSTINIVDFKIVHRTPKYKE